MCGSGFRKLKRVTPDGQRRPIFRQNTCLATHVVGAPSRPARPSPLDIEIEDIAHGLARVARWNGQTVGEHAFSVAQHSLLVDQIFTRLVPDASVEWQLLSLLHDAPEYVIGDMISPFKAVMGGNYKMIEMRLENAIHLRFSLPITAPAQLKTLIKRADQVAAFSRPRDLPGSPRPRPSNISGVRVVSIRQDWISHRAPRKTCRQIFSHGLQHWKSTAGPMSRIVVTPLSQLATQLTLHRPSHVVTLGSEAPAALPDGYDAVRLSLTFNDIIELREGLVAPMKPTCCGF